MHCMRVHIYEYWKVGAAISSLRFRSLTGTQIALKVLEKLCALFIKPKAKGKEKYTKRESHTREGAASPMILEMLQKMNTLELARRDSAGLRHLRVAGLVPSWHCIWFPNLARRDP